MSTHRAVGIIVRNRAATRFYVQQKDAAYPRFPLAYSLFGGTIEPGEDPAKALARELGEELGAAIAATLLAAAPTLAGEFRVGPGGFEFALFEAVVDDAILDQLAAAPVFEGERGAVFTRDELRALPFIHGLEAVILAYLDR